jgi:hypothetical protein
MYMQVQLSETPPKRDYMLAATSFKYILDAGSMPFRGRHAHAGTNVLNAPKTG